MDSVKFRYNSGATVTTLNVPYVENATPRRDADEYDDINNVIREIIRAVHLRYIIKFGLLSETNMSALNAFIIDDERDVSFDGGTTYIDVAVESADIKHRKGQIILIKKAAG